MTPIPRRLQVGGIAALAATSLVAGGAGASISSAQPEGGSGLARAAQPTAVPVERIGGENRYQTAAAIAAEYPASAEVVYIASGAAYPDALTARDAAGATAGESTPQGDDLGIQSHDGGAPAPVLLTKPDSLPEATASALADLDPTTIRVIGGTGAISADVEDALTAYGSVERIGGENRYQTAAGVAALFPTGLPVVFVATGQDFPDALAAGAPAGRAHAPVLLTKGGSLPGATADALTELAPQSVVIFGGRGAVSQEVQDAITQIVPDTTRIGGPNRYATAARLAAVYEKDAGNVFVATGESYPDALTGSALAGYQGVPILLSRPDGLPNRTYNGLDFLSPQGLTLLGGTAAIDTTVQAELDAALVDWVDRAHLQLLSFNDYHGHLEAEDGATLAPEHDPEGNVVGGAEYLSTTLDALRTGYFEDQSMTVAAGDLIGGSTFLSGIFHDEPSVESLELMELDVSSVGNHEFDEGTDELLRMQNGGCHPEDGCYFPEEPYDGADFPWLAANVVMRDNPGETLLPGTHVREIAGVKVGFIGMTLEETPTLVSPAGVQEVQFLDEVQTANEQAATLQADGVQAIVVLLHEGGYQTGTYDGCEGISGPIVDIHNGLDPAIDAIVTGHTHEPYTCSLADPAGNPRTVTSAAQFGRVVTETDLVLDRTTGDVIREEVGARNHLVLRQAADPQMSDLLAKWQAAAGPIAGEVQGTVVEDITGDATTTDRDEVTPMANLVADAILFGTDGADEGGAQISFMNVGGVRASFLVDQISNEEEPGEITYEEAYNVAPFGNILVSVDMTGAQVKAALEEQYIPDRGRATLALGVSEGFTYTWEDAQPQGSRVSGMALNGVPLEMEATYRVSTLNFLQEGGDGFTAFTEGTNLQGGPEDLANLVTYLNQNPGLEAPECRVEGICSPEFGDL